MAKRGFLSVRLGDETLSELDEIAKRRLLSRSEAVRTLIAAERFDPYQVLQDASRGEFSSAFFTYLVSLNPGSGLDVMILREWLIRNPYHPKAHERVHAVVAHSFGDLSSKLKDDAKRLEELAGSPALEKEYEEFMSEERERASHKPEEDIEDGERYS